VDILVILFLSLAIDLAVGEPPRVLHPVVWMGKVTSLLEKSGISQPRTVQLIYGLGMILVIMVLFVAPAYFLLPHLKNLSLAAYVIIGAILLKTTFSLRELRRTAVGIKNLLQKDKIDEARFELRSLVHRDTDTLSKPLLVSATVESIAENTSDSFIAPLFYFLLFGVPGAIAYRVVNTLDAMIGYHGKYEYLGKAASRMDDVLNFVPARLTALFLVWASFLSRRNGQMSWQVAINDHTKTESPNAGWPMAAVAGALNVQLEKTGHYKLGDANTPPTPATIDASLELMQIATLAWALTCFMIGGIRFVITA
jgi:adenosylcobinamide-phosphate synthase